MRGLCNALACGVMVAASFDLMNEGQMNNGPLALVGLVFGAAFVYYTQKRFQGMDNLKFSELTGMNARKALMIIGIMTLHSVGEGAGVGVSFSGSKGWTNGTLMVLAIGVHNIPEGLAIAMVLVSRGVSAMNATWWSIFTSLPQPIVAVLAFVFVQTFRTYLSFSLGFAAGCMLYVVFAELIPDALKEVSSQSLGVVIILSVALLEVFRLGFESLSLGGLEHVHLKDGTTATYLNWVSVSVYATAVTTPAAVVAILLAVVIRKKYAAINVIKVLIVVYAVAFVCAIATRDFVKCGTFYTTLHMNPVVSIFCIGVGVVAANAYKILNVIRAKQDIALPHDSMESPKKGKKALASSTEVPVYAIAALTVWTFSLGLSFYSRGIAAGKSRSIDVAKIFFACFLAAMVSSATKSKTRGMLVAGLTVAAGVGAGAGVAILYKKGTFLNGALHAMSLGAVYAFFTFAVQTIESKRGFSNSSRKYWLFVLSSVLLGVFSGLVLAIVQGRAVDEANTYLMSFC